MSEPKPILGANLLLGLDRLTTPMFEFLGLKLRDTVRTWMSAKAKDRAALRRFEKDFLYRQIDIRNYADDQFTGLLDLIAERMIERHISTFKPLMKHGA